MTAPSHLPSPSAPRDGVGSFRTALRVVGIAGLLGILFTVAVGQKAPLATGTAPPALVGTTLDGGALDIADFRGDLVFVNVWATWCAPCRMELPELALAAKRHTDVHFVGLLADGGEGADAILAQAGTPYPNVLINDATERAWNVDALPASFLLGPDGRVLWSMRGAIDGGVVDDVIAAARVRP